jgi:hypothetical protein
MGVRRNNSKLVQSAKFLSKELFHGRSHPRYQELEIIDHFKRIAMPKDLQNFEEEHESMTKTGDDAGKSKGQGFDFILEEENKEIKQWIRRGVPTNKIWLSVIRNKCALKEIKNKLLNIIGNDNVADRELAIADTIHEWRIALRKSRSATDLDSRSFKSIMGEPLHDGLQHFTSVAQQKRGYRVMDMLLHQDPPEGIYLSHPVYTTPDDYNEGMSLTKQTIAEIDRLILVDIAAITDEMLKKSLTDKLRTTVLGKKKEIHLNFLNEVKACKESSFLAAEENMVQE